MQITKWEVVTASVWPEGGRPGGPRLLCAAVDLPLWRHDPLLAYVLEFPLTSYALFLSCFSARHLTFFSRFHPSTTAMSGNCYPKLCRGLACRRQKLFCKIKSTSSWRALLQHASLLPWAFLHIQFVSTCLLNGLGGTFFPASFYTPEEICFAGLYGAVDWS